MGDRRRDGEQRRDDTNPSIFMAAFDDLVIELEDGDIEMVEQTVVREVPKKRREG